MSPPLPSPTPYAGHGLRAALRAVLGRWLAEPPPVQPDGPSPAAPAKPEPAAPAAVPAEVQARIDSLTQALHDAEAASQAKSRFLGRLSHELRTPMNGVIGMTQLLANSSLDDTQRNYVELIERSASGLLGLLGELLDFARLESGQLELQPQPVQLRLLLDEVAAVVAGKARDKQLLFECHLAADLPAVVRADPQRLRQVCLNLLHNAIKFTSVGQVVLAARREGDMLRLDVSDTGAGIAPDVQARIFTPFVQGDDSLSRRQGGIGLGLSLVSTLVRVMGGSITLSSEPSRGATFSVRLPLPMLAPEDAPASAELAQRVALISDAPATQAALRDRLAYLGHSMAAAMSWRELAFEPESLAALAPDAVVYDEPLGGWPAELVPRMEAGAAGGWRTVLLERRPDIGLLSGAVPLQRPLSDASLARALAPSAAAGTAGLARSAPEAAARGRVLLVEDNEINQVVARSFLEHLGFQVDVAADAQAALLALQAHDPVLVLMDCQLPGVDGYELTRRLRAGDAGARAQRLPVIALTAHATAADRDRCLEAGMNDYLAKPVKQEQLAEVLGRWLAPART